MKTFRFVLVLLAAIAVMTSCKEDMVMDNPVPVNNNISDDELVVEINGEESKGAHTRVAYSGWTTTFEAGDQIGVYCWNGTSVVASNIPFTKQSNGTWTANSTKVPYNASYTYFCYFPYNASHGYTPSTSGNADTRFATFITDANNKFWNENQFNKASYDASNLMVGAGTHVGSGNKVRFAMDHKRGLAVFTGDANKVLFTGNNKAYKTGGKGYFLMKPSTNTDFFIDSKKVTLSANAGKYVQNNLTVDYEGQYIAFTALEAGSFSLTIGAGVYTSYLTSVSYSIDEGATWVTTNNTNSQVVITTPNIAAGNRVLWKGVGQRMSTVTIATSGTTRLTNSSIFRSTGRFDVSGNAMSLLYGDNFAGQKTLSGSSNFACLFYSYPSHISDPAKVVNTENMIFPAETVPGYSYMRMFQGSTTLTTAPKFNGVVTVGVDGMCAMFHTCTSLISPPALPATTVDSNGYDTMFGGCSSLTSVPELPATSVWQLSYSNMFLNCTSLTTVSQNLLPATEMVEQCYNRMFYGCTKLTNVPNLPATTLAHVCYCEMFAGCTSLTSVPTNLLPNTELAQSCYYGMFQNCNKLKTAPDLPATTLVNSCYRNMFSGCSSLNYIKCLATNISATGCTMNMTAGVSGSGVFVKAAGMNSWTTGANGIPSGWTIQTN